MKKLILALVSATSLATQCEPSENWKATFRRLDKQAGHVFVMGTTIVSSGFAAATGASTIAVVAPIVAGAAIIAAHTRCMSDNKKLAEEQKLLAIEIARQSNAPINISPAKPLTDANAIEKGAVKLPQ